MTKKRGVVLLSGGLDSAVTLYSAAAECFKVNAVTFDYGQLHKKEILSAKSIAAAAGVEHYFFKIDLSFVRSSLTDKTIAISGGSSLTGKEAPSTYVSGRNMIFLSYAFSFAESIGAGRVYIGAHVQDYPGYPDCRPEFLKSFQVAARFGLCRKNIALRAPLLYKKKKDIIRLGLRLGVPFELTWSCYKGKAQPCGACDSCRFRTGGFKSLGIRDPLSSN